MPRVRRSEFIEARLPRQFDLKAARADPAFMARLQAAGLKPEDLDKLDLYGHDGVVRGPRELHVLFDLLKTLDAGGATDTLGAGGSPGSAQRVDGALAAFESRFEASSVPPAGLPTLDGTARGRFPLASAVGPGAPNRADDVRRVQERLREIGFDVGADGQWGKNTERALQVYRSMLTGTDDSTEEPGRIEPGDLLHIAFAQQDPPKWVEMPRQGEGFVNEDTDHFGFGSAESRSALQAFSATYAREYLAAHPGAAKISLNDVSQRSGGKNRDHESHQNGLDLDMRLPRTDGTSGSDVRHSNYDREAAYAMLSAIASNPRVERVLFSDTVLLARAKERNEPWAYKVFDGGPVHRNHLHADIKPPVVLPE